MKALTVWQPWATLIVAGLKLYEFRRYPAPKSLVGQTIVIHAGKRPPKSWDIESTLAAPSHTTGNPDADRQVIDLLTPIWRRSAQMPLAAGLGTARLGEPRRALDIFRGAMDPADIHPDIWGWPMTDAEAWPAPVPARGHQGFWEWDPLGAGRSSDADLFSSDHEGPMR